MILEISIPLLILLIILLVNYRYGQYQALKRKSVVDERYEDFKNKYDLLEERLQKAEQKLSAVSMKNL